MEKNLQKLLEQIQQDEKPLSLSEAAKYLDLSKNYLYKLTHKNQITFFKPAGKKIYFKKSDLNKYLFRNRKASELELEQKAVDYATQGASL